MADKDGRHSEMITQLLLHVTSSPHDADAKGDSLRRTIYPLSLVVIPFLFSELRRRGEGAESVPPRPPVVEGQKKPSISRVNNRAIHVSDISVFYSRK